MVTLEAQGGLQASVHIYQLVVERVEREAMGTISAVVVEQ
jgi:hypothetical protein